MTPRGRAALVLGLLLFIAAIVAATVTIHAGQHNCGSALSAHAPRGQFLRPGSESKAEHQCDRKVTGRRELAAVVGGIGALVAIAGAYDHERSR